MYDNNSRGISYTAGFFILIAFAVAGIFFAQTANFLIWNQMTGLAATDMEKNFGTPAYANVMKIMQAVNAVVGFFIPAVVTASMLNRKPFQLLGFSKRIKAEQVGLVVLLIGASLIVSTALSYFNNHIPIPDVWRVRFDKAENEYNQQVAAIINLKTGTDYIVALITMGFLPALCEETFFRGGLQNFLSRGTKGHWLAIIVVSILFSLAHISFYGFLSRFFLGIVLGAIYHYSGRLWLSILAHFINNAVALTVFYVYIQKGKPMEEIMKNDTSTPWGIIVLLIVIALLVIFKRVSLVNRRSE